MSIIIDNLIHSRRRTVALIIQPDGKLTVRAPLRMSEIEILKFVRAHDAWIKKTQDRINSSPSLPKKNFRSGESFPYLGKEYPLFVVPHQRTALIFSDSKFQLSDLNFQRARQAFIDWYKTQARIDISKRVASFASINKFNYFKIRISSARTRWGSCSSAGTLSFTWRLVMAPPEIIDYVVLHELVHTQIRNHSRKFWYKLGEVLPEYKTYLYWLKQNGKLLTVPEEA